MTKDQIKKSQLLQKLEKSDSRKELVTARRMETIQLRTELERSKVSQQRTKLQLLKHIREKDAEDKITMREQQRSRATNLKAVRLELMQVRKQMAKEFFEKKTLIVEKLKELKQSNKSIEEIYKYTNDIILEEEDEDDEDDEPTRSTSELKLGSREGRTSSVQGSLEAKQQLKVTSQLNRSVDYSTSNDQRE